MADSVARELWLPESVCDEVVGEIQRAIGKHGDQSTLPDCVWLAIATEEIGEVAEAVLAEGFGKPDPGHTDEEIVQSIAVLVHWLEIRRMRRE